MYRLLIIFSFIFEMGVAQAKSFFIQVCERPEAHEVEFRNDIKWFKYFYNTEDCREIANKISKVKGLSEVILPYFARTYNKALYTWTDDFPHLYGLHNSTVAYSKFENFFDRHTLNKVFKSLDLYKEFKNITDLAYSHDYSYSYEYSVCEVLETLPHIKSVSIDSELLTEEADQCLLQANVEVIIRGYFEIKFPIKSKVIGIENYAGAFSQLAQFEHLIYIGISRNASNQGGLKTLSGYSNITHLSINNSEIKGIENLGSMVNLSYLSLSCIENEEFKPYPVCESGTYLTNTDFLKNLRWLRHLILNYHDLEKIADISNLSHLTTLELEGNKLKSIPDLSKNGKLKYLAVGGNKFTNLKDFTKIKSLEYLDLSDNLITDFTGLNNLTRLVHLNLSNNPLIDDLSKLIPPKSLKVLSLNGEGRELQIAEGNDELAGMDWYLDDVNSYLTEYLSDSFTTPVAWYEKTLKEVVDRDLSTYRPLVTQDADFSHLKHIEYLSLRFNHFKKFPNVQGMTNLKYLDLDGNDLQILGPNDYHPGIITLDLTDNLFTKIPNMAKFKSLRKLDIMANRISSLNNMTLPTSLKNLAVAHNQIKNLTPLSATRFKDLKLFLYGNQVKKNRYFCPLKSANSYLTEFCDRYINNKDAIEADCGDWCYEPEI